MSQKAAKYLIVAIELVRILPAIMILILFSWKMKRRDDGSALAWVIKIVLLISGLNTAAIFVSTIIYMTMDLSGEHPIYERFDTILTEAV